MSSFVKVATTGFHRFFAASSPLRILTFTNIRPQVDETVAPSCNGEQFVHRGTLLYHPHKWVRIATTCDDLNSGEVGQTHPIGTSAESTGLLCKLPPAACRSQPDRGSVAVKMTNLSFRLPAMTSPRATPSGNVRECIKLTPSSGIKVRSSIQ